MSIGSSMPPRVSGRHGTTRPSSIYDVLPQPRQRAFIVGATGSGKSTLAVALLEAYHRRFPLHVLYIVDPKRRFVAVDVDDIDSQRQNHSPLPLFPDGFAARVHGKREGVAVHGDYMDRPRRPPEGESAVYVVQDEEVQHALYDWLYEHSDVRRPSLLYLDESFDLQKATRADPSFRRLLQQGREIGVGAWVINQRPKWIDATFITEAQHLFIGRLARLDDRKALADAVMDEQAADEVLEPLPPYWWLWIDQSAHPSRYVRFTLDKSTLQRTHSRS